MAVPRSWRALEAEVVACRRCPRLVEHRETVARTRRRAFRDEEYWGRPVPGFGDRRARIFLLGLAPAAHGANRTGRMFTGDRSGDWLYAALHRAGLASQPHSTARDDGLALTDVYVSAACRCAPPGNLPTRDEMDACAPFFERELELLRDLRVAIALGRIAWDALFRRAARVAPGAKLPPRSAFAHGAEIALPLRRAGESIPVLASYHPSQQNTQTGRLTEGMLDRVLGRGRELAHGR